MYSGFFDQLILNIITTQSKKIYLTLNGVIGNRQ